MTITRNNVNESQYKQNNHNHDHDRSDNKNPNTANEAFVISVMRRQNDVLAPKPSANVYVSAFIGTLRQLTRAEVLCDTRQWFG